jgi:hypothetical protein
MVVFLKSIDSKTWKAIVKGWKEPVISVTEGSTTTLTLKKEEEWSKEEDEDEEALANSKALNAIFNGVDKNMFKLINTCTVAKDAWEILKVAREGTSRVQMSRLQMLTTQFENMKMAEEETISEFHMRICDMANASFALGEKKSNEKLVRKILGSLPKRFDMKVTSIEEAQDIDSMQVDELIGSLQTYELTLNEKYVKKHKYIEFVSNINGDDDHTEVDMGEEVLDVIALLGRQFNRVFRKFDKKPRPYV